MDYSNIDLKPSESFLYRSSVSLLPSFCSMGALDLAGGSMEKKTHGPGSRVAFELVLIQPWDVSVVVQQRMKTWHIDFYILTLM